MTIKRASDNVINDKKFQYKMTKSPNVQKLKDAVGQIINVKAFCFYDDSADGENEKIILTLLADDGTVYGTNSKTAMSNFDDITEFFIDEVMTERGLPIIVESSVSKNGREFIMLNYAG